MAFLKRLERWGRRRAADVLSGRTCSRQDSSPAEPRRTLVVRTDSRLGNLVLMEPLLRSLRERFPNARLDVLASHVFAPLLESQGYNVIKVEKKRQIREPDLFLDLIGTLRGNFYDIAIDAAHPHSFSLSGAVSALISGAEASLSTDAGESRGWYAYTVPEPPMDWHESRALHSLGALWEGWPEWTPPRLAASGIGRRDALGVHVGASGNKRYPPERMEELLERICRNAIVEIYWGSDSEFSEARKLSEKYPVALMPALDVRELVDAVSGLRLFVTADNGPMHVASALSVPVVALFRNDNVERFRPLSQGSVVLYDPMGPEPGLVADEINGILGYF